MKKLVIIAALLVSACSLSGCTGDRTEITRVLEEHGYTEVEVLGFDMFGCSKDDDTATKFRAKGPTGRPVKGVVCGSWSFWGKGYTVRTY